MSERISGEKLEHLNIQKITEDEETYCIPNSDGKVKLIISKEPGEALVTISRQ